MCRTLTYWVSFMAVLCLALAGGAKAADPNLAGWWPLNEGIGETAIDMSGNGMDGTINNPTNGLGVDGSVWVEDADLGTVISFDGTASGAYVRAGSIPQMTLENDFTWSFWAKQAPGNGANDIILGNRMDETPADFVPRQFIKFTPTKFEWHMNGNGDDNMDYEDIPDDVWLHHVVVKAGDQLTYYRNGVASSSGVITQALDVPQPLYFGGDNENAEGENWAGSMSDVRIYDGALTPLGVMAVTLGVDQIDMAIAAALEAPVIDGEVDTVWNSASTQSFVPLDDPADGSGTWKVLYDTENLYVLLDITDDSLNNDSSAAWQDDSVEVYFDGGNTKLTTALSGDDHQYTFGWTADDIQGTNIDGATEGIEQGQVTTDTGWRIEIKMPWLSIQGAAPQAGDLIGIDCYYNDDDDGGDSREGKMLSFSAVEGWNDASQWGTAVLAAAPTPVDPGADGLVAYYPMDGDATDASGNGLDGTVMGDPAWIDGALDGAIECDGEGDYVDVAHADALDITGAISLSLWIRPDAEDPEGQGLETAPMSKALSGASPSWSWQVRYGWGSAQPYMAFTFNTSPRAWAYVGRNLDQGEWSHIACSADGETLTAYLNGMATESTAMGAITSSPTPVLIGSDGWGSDWIGGIDEVAIYNRALSAEEVLYLAGVGAEAGDESLSIHFTFDEVGETVADQSGNGNDGAVVGDVVADAEGAVNGGAKFADGGYLDLDGPNVAAENIPTTGMTLAAWIKCENNGGHHAIFNARASDSTWIVHPEARSDGVFRWLLRAYGGTSMFDVRAGAVTWDEWQHFVGTYDEATAKAAVYTNGELASEVDVADAADIAGDWDMGARVGKNIDDARPFTGLMDEFCLFTRALSQDEIIDLMGGM